MFLSGTDWDPYRQERAKVLRAVGGGGTPETLPPFTGVFFTMVTPIGQPSILPMPADIQGQVGRTTRGLSVTERCNRLALLVTSPLIPADRCEECSRLVGRSYWLIGCFSPWTIVQTLTASFFFFFQNFSISPFARGQKVVIADNKACQWRRGEGS